MGTKQDLSIQEGIQGTTVRAWVDNNTPSYGTTNYYNIQGTISSGTSNLEKYLSDYKSYMENFYEFQISNIGLLDRKDAIENLGMSSAISTNYAFNEASKYKNWMTYTTFWFAAESANTSGYIFYLNTENKIREARDISGVRPAITIPTNLIPFKEKSIAIKVGTKIFLKNNQNFYVVNSNNENTVLFAEYNLNVGENQNNSVDYCIQAPSIRAWYSNDKDATNYGSTKYYDIIGDRNSGTSQLNSYLSYYKNYLEQTNALEIINISLLKRNDAINYLNMIPNRGAPAFNDNSAYKNWMTNTTFWFEEEGSNLVWYLNAQNRVDVANDISGIRPAVNIKTIDVLKYMN